MAWKRFALFNFLTHAYTSAPRIEPDAKSRRGQHQHHCWLKKSIQAAAQRNKLCAAGLATVTGRCLATRVTWPSFCGSSQHPTGCRLRRAGASKAAGLSEQTTCDHRRFQCLLISMQFLRLFHVHHKSIHVISDDISMAFTHQWEAVGSCSAPNRARVELQTSQRHIINRPYQLHTGHYDMLQV